MERGSSFFSGEDVRGRRKHAQAEFETGRLPKTNNVEKAVGRNLTVAPSVAFSNFGRFHEIFRGRGCNVIITTHTTSKKIAVAYDTFSSIM